VKFFVFIDPFFFFFSSITTKKKKKKDSRGDLFEVSKLKFSSTVTDTYVLPTSNDKPDPACWFTSYLSLKETATNYQCLKNINSDTPLTLSGKLFSEEYAPPASGVVEFVLDLDCSEQNCAGNFGGDDCRFDTDCGAFGVRTSDMIREMSVIRLAFSKGKSVVVSAKLPHYTIDFSLSWVVQTPTPSPTPPPTPAPPTPLPTPLPPGNTFAPTPPPTPLPTPPPTPLLTTANPNVVASTPPNGLPLSPGDDSLAPTVAAPDGAPDNTVTIVICVVVGLVVCLLIVLAIIYVVVRSRQQQTYPYPNDPYATQQNSMMMGQNGMMMGGQNGMMMGGQNGMMATPSMIQQHQFGTQQQYASSGYHSSSLPQMGYSGGGNGSHVQPYADMPSGHHTASSFSQQNSYYGQGSIDGMGSATSTGGGYTDIMRSTPMNQSAADLPDLPNSGGATRPW
jgi:hypothetical protein